MSARTFTLAMLSSLLLDVAGEPAGGDELSLLQQRLDVTPPARPAAKAGLRKGSEAAAEAEEEEGSDAGRRDLVLMHVPYNFGHTIERVAMFGGGLASFQSLAFANDVGDIVDVSQTVTWERVNQVKRQDGEVWGHMNPDLHTISDATGCPMFYTPQKYWPEQLAAKYFGNKTVFGVLRDPYERLVAIARGMIKDFGYDPAYKEDLQSCQVNNVVKMMLKDYINGSRFKDSCLFLPQAEYFDGPHGITLPIDNREFPASMNRAFGEHGYRGMRIGALDVMHVFQCTGSWAGDLDEETRALARLVYARDFELLCKHFGYCNQEENTCIYQVPLMCPLQLIREGYHGQALPMTDGYSPLNISERSVVVDTNDLAFAVTSKLEQLGHAAAHLAAAARQHGGLLHWLSMP